MHSIAFNLGTFTLHRYEIYSLIGIAVGITLFFWHARNAKPVFKIASRPIHMNMFLGAITVIASISFMLYSIYFKGNLGKVVFQFPVLVYWYGIMVAIGFVCATALMVRNRKYAGMDTEQITDMALWGMVAGIIGARIFYVCQFWNQYENNLFQIIMINKGGLVFYGGFICATIVLLIYARKQKLEVLKVMDILAPSLAVGHMFGRIGCFLNGCCFGKTTDLPWAVTFPAGSPPAMEFPTQPLNPNSCPSLPLHPVQLYESVFNMILAIVLLFLLRRLKPGQTVSIYLICYGIGRFTIESMRGDHHQFILQKFTVSQSIGLFVAAGGIALLTYTIRRTSGSKVEK